jgi:serine/threonine-protein kinase
MDLKKIQNAYAEVLALHGSKRQLFIERLRDEDPLLAARLDELLQTGGLDDEFLRESIEASAARLSEEVNDPWIGSELDGYRVIERIAAGGMGAVYLARRSDEEFEHTVAIKFLTTGMATDELKSRFLGERQILAQLNHPNVARLLGGGTTDAGVPYLVMEFIAGLPVDKYCEAHGLSSRQRLELFEKICAAVQYAHQNLVVHRDIKASNILVGEDGEPKLLDFGIAKITDPENLAHTQADIRVLTPESASPEQISGAPISTATDVYALGLLLYRLLTGHFPYHIEGDTARAVYQAILESDPERPSTIVGTGNHERSDINVEQLRKELAGDLDTIILTALRKEPERRYGTVRQFSEDIDNYLTDQPVLARRDSMPYRASKFFRRHRVPVAVGAAAFGLVVALVAFYTFRLAEERDRATLEAEKSAEVSTFLSDLFRSSSPFEFLGGTPDAVDLLERGVERADELEGQPLLQANLYRVMARSFFYLGQYERSTRLFETAISILRNTPGAEPLELATALRDYAEQLSVTNRNDEGLPLIQEALALKRSILGPQNEDIAQDMASLAAIYGNLFEVDKAVATFEAALAMKQAIDPAEDKILLIIKADMAVALDNAGRFEDATRMHEEVVALSRKLYGEDDPNLAIRLNNLAILYLRQGRYELAWERSAESLKIVRAVLPADHEQQMSILDLHIATLMHTNRFAEMEEALARLDKMVLELRGEQSYRNRMALYRRGMTEDYRRQYTAALASYKRAYEIALAMDGPEDGWTLFHEAYYGRAAFRAGDIATAEPLLADALSREDELFFGHLMNAKMAMIELLSVTGRFAEAERLLDEALPALIESSGANRGGLVDIYAIAADHYRRKADLDSAREYADEALALARQYHADNPVDAGKALLSAAEVYDAAGDTEIAVELFTEYVERTLPIFGADEASIQRVRARLDR